MVGIRLELRQGNKMTDDKPPSIEDNRNIAKFSGFTNKPSGRVLFWDKAFPLASGVGVCGLRHPIFIPLLGFNGKVK